ncbi:MAG: hypothetical protein WC028_28350 [Candidatus Obscuribacterales bacterium]
MIKKLVVGAVVSTLFCQPVLGAELERSDIAGFHVTEVADGKIVHLHIRGLPMYSGDSGCSNLKSKLSGDELRLQSTRRLFRRGVPFDFMVDVPSGIKRVVFGPSRKQIWPKDELAESVSEREQKAIDLATESFRKERPDADLNDYHIFLSGNVSDPLTKNDHYRILAVQDGPAPCAVREAYVYWVKTADYSVINKGRSFSGQGLLLRQLGKLERECRN